MKKVFVFAAFAIATVPSIAQVRYSVSGTFIDNGKKVYLIDHMTDQAVDSMVVADGKFSFSGTADQDALMAVKAENRKWETDFLPIRMP